ncbi:hypothetical protein ScalyP_jg4444 [Parmales sp. scaly parma]|nr:hypothetical protein ScalyP_jg4444 [Parmales sp. scaly parma]
MSVVGNNRIGIPLILLHDGEGAIITVETKNGDMYRGFLFEAEDTMNLVMKKAIYTDAAGRTKTLDSVFIRGSQILFVVLPTMLRHAPMFKRIDHWRAKGGAPMDTVGTTGQAAAILRKSQNRDGFDGGGRGGRGGGGRFGPGGGRGMMDGRGFGPRGPAPQGGVNGGGMGGHNVPSALQQMQQQQPNMALLGQFGQGQGQGQGGFNPPPPPPGNFQR